MKHARLILLLSAALAGCATYPRPAFERFDGKPIAPGSVLERQFDLDRTICQGETDKAKMGATRPIALDPISAGIAVNKQFSEETSVARGCMAQRGYVIVPSKDPTKTLIGLPGEAGPNGMAKDFNPLEAIPHN